MAKRYKKEAVGQLPHVIRDLPVEWKGEWKTRFKVSKLVCDIGCGRGDFIVEYAKEQGDTLFVGFEVDSARVYDAVDKTIKYGVIERIWFILADALSVDQVFSEGEVDEIWILFPDPQPRKSKANKRLTSIKFLQKFHHVLNNNGMLYVKTDEDWLADYTISQLKLVGFSIVDLIEDLHRIRDELNGPESIFTEYERKLVYEYGKQIFFIKAKKAT